MGIPDKLLNHFRTMQTIRCFEESLCPYIEDGTIKTPCHLYIGQEAVATGVCSELNPTDLIWGNHRSHGHYIAKGGDIDSMMSEIFCRSTGCSGGRGGSMHLLASDVGIMGTVPIVAGTVPLAVGAGIAFSQASDGRVSVAFLGDGATEEGHVIESINMAALYDLPVLFIIENNLYSSHMHMSERRRQPDLSKIAELHGVPFAQIDGNDVETVAATTAELITPLREGNGPAILECYTFRWRGHVGPKWDEDVGVKRKGELQEWIAKDPVARVRDKLLQEGYKDGALNSICSDIEQSIESGIKKALAAPFPFADSLVDNVFVDSSASN